MGERRFLNGVEVRVVGEDFCLFLVERIDGKPLDDYGLRKRDWVSKAAIRPYEDDRP